MKRTDSEEAKDLIYCVWAGTSVLIVQLVFRLMNAMGVLKLKEYCKQDEAHVILEDRVEEPLECIIIIN